MTYTPEDRVRNWHDRLLKSVSLPTTIDWKEYNRVIDEMAQYFAWKVPEKAIVFERKGIKLERVVKA